MIVLEVRGREINYERSSYHLACSIQSISSILLICVEGLGMEEGTGNVEL
jgi:hypothetical protein